MAVTVNTKFYIKQNDLLPDLTGQFLDEITGIPQDLTGATLLFHMKDPVTGTVKINRAASIDGTPTDGRFRFLWESGDTDTAGTFEGEIQATFGIKPLTGPNRRNFKVVIAPEIA